MEPTTSSKQQDSALDSGAGHKVTLVQTETSGESAHLAEKWHWAAAVLLALLSFSMNSYIASRRLFWFDEIFTVAYARVPDIGAMLKAVAASDQTPVGYYILARGAYSLFRHWDVSIRLLSALAMAATLIALFDCARRLTDGLRGLIAPCVLLASRGAVFGYEARPYSVMMLLSTMSLWLWLNKSQSSRPTAVMFGAVCFLGQFTHFYWLLCLIPFGVWEIWRYKLRRFPPPMLVAGAMGVLCALALSWSQIEACLRMPRAGALWSPPSVPGIPNVFSTLFPNSLVLIASIIAIAVLPSLGKQTAAPMGDGERLSWLFVLIPIFGYILAKSIVGLFVFRYFVTLLPGVAVGSACLIGRHCAARLQIAGILLLLAGFAIYPQLLTASDPSRAYVGREDTATRAGLALERGIWEDGKRFITSPDPTVIAEVRYYSAHPERYVQIRNHPWDGLISQYDGSFVYWNVDELREHAAETAVIFPSTAFLEAMAQSRVATTLAHDNPAVLYLNTESEHAEDSLSR